MILIQVEPHLKNLLPDFLERRRADVDSMKAFFDQGDYEAIRVFGHNMKGIGGSFGLEGLTDIGRALELAALNNRIGEMEGLLDNLLDYINSVQVV